MRFARECAPFVAPPLLVSAALFWWGLTGWGVAALALAALLLLFFRIPRHRPPADEDLVLAPASGRVTRIDLIEDPGFGDQPVTRIVTFLSVFDVHVQRCPVAGRVEMRRFVSGRKVAAFRSDAAEVNESEMSVFETTRGERVGVRQVVGLLARRIVCYLSEGDEVLRGELLGLIKFGSRVDLLMPGSWGVLVQEGDRVRGGETPVARRALRGGEAE